jgi:hypothetical protein
MRYKARARRTIEASCWSAVAHLRCFDDVCRGRRRRRRCGVRGVPIVHADNSHNVRSAAPVVAKRVDRPYRSGRSETWIKVKAKRKMTLPIIGYVPAKGNSIAALRLGRREGTLRRDCLDHVLIFGAWHLRRILTSYSCYYNETRTHLSLDKDAPLGRAVQRHGTIVATPILSGLHHCYARI